METTRPLGVSTDHEAPGGNKDARAYSILSCDLRIGIVPSGEKSPVTDATGRFYRSSASPIWSEECHAGPRLRT
jgi:hypothetical protein